MSWTTINKWSITLIPYDSKELWPGQEVSVCVHFDIGLGDIIHDTLFGHGQQ